MLTAAAISVLMKRLNDNTKVEMKKICIGIDGSLYRFHPRFNMGIQRHLKALGIFARQATLYKNPSYLQYVPRTLKYIQLAADKYSELNVLARLIERIVA